jgi:hypothetical protein
MAGKAKTAVKSLPNPALPIFHSQQFYAKEVTASQRVTTIF